MTARVAGVVERVRFREGERVAAGAVLVEIEPQRYQLAVESARAALAKTRAAEADAAGRARAPREGGGRHARPDPRRGDRDLAHPPAHRRGRRAPRSRRRSPRPSSTCATPTCARRWPASSRPARCRPGSTCSRARCWPRWSGASRCCCASACPSPRRPRCGRGMTARFRLRERPPDLRGAHHPRRPGRRRRPRAWWRSPPR